LKYILYNLKPIKYERTLKLLYHSALVMADLTAGPELIYHGTPKTTDTKYIIKKSI
jgi:hypothetical protein